MSGPRSRPTSQKIWYHWESNPDLWISSLELWPLDRRGGSHSYIYTSIYTDNKFPTMTDSLRQEDMRTGVWGSQTWTVSCVVSATGVIWTQYSVFEGYFNFSKVWVLQLIKQSFNRMGLNQKQWSELWIPSVNILLIILYQIPSLDIWPWPITAIYSTDLNPSDFHQGCLKDNKYRNNPSQLLKWNKKFHLLSSEPLSRTINQVAVCFQWQLKVVLDASDSHTEHIFQLCYCVNQCQNNFNILNIYIYIYICNLN
jgi:hypothetical protein